MTQQLNLIELPTPKLTKGTKRRPWLDFTPPSADKILQILSYGAGKQTFYMLVAVEQGLLPKPDLVIFADTKREKPKTYQHIRQYVIPLCEKLGIEFVWISGGNLYKYLWRKQTTADPPKCTTQFKIQVILNYLRKRYGLKPRLHQVDMWIGITTDEDHRQTPSGVAYVRKVFPLLQLGISRDDCIVRTTDAGYPVPPKSGCLECPHIGTKGWRSIKLYDPVRFKVALLLEDNAAKRRPGTHLPEFGPSLRTIQLQAAFGGEFDEDNADTDNCSSGYCFV